MKKYVFKMPEVKKIEVISEDMQSNWLDAQSFPVYAYIPKDCQIESPSTGGGYTELECAWE